MVVALNRQVDLWGSVGDGGGLRGGVRLKFDDRDSTIGVLLGTVPN